MATRAAVQSSNMFSNSLLRYTSFIVDASQCYHEIFRLCRILPSSASGRHSMHNQGRMLGMLEYHGCMHPRSMQF
jgi:hypothetical protein